MSVLRLAALVLIAAVAGGLIWKTLPARTSAVAGPDPIAALIPAEIGGMTQWLLIRGADRRAPVLLWLHGGSGSAQMPIHGVTAALERDFVVVHWDQRGAGKSNPPGFDSATMTLERFLADAREVTALLRDRIGDQPLIVLGHSWGTMLGARLVARWPEEYAGYIGVGQQVDTMRGVVLALDWLGEVAPDSEFVGMAPQDFRDHAQYVRLMQAVEAQGGGRTSRSCRCCRRRWPPRNTGCRITFAGSTARTGAAGRCGRNIFRATCSPRCRICRCRCC